MCDLTHQKKDQQFLQEGRAEQALLEGRLSLVLAGPSMVDLDEAGAECRNWNLETDRSFTLTMKPQ